MYGTFLSFWINCTRVKEVLNVWIRSCQRTLVNLWHDYVYLVDPASSHTLVLKIKPCMSKCFDCLTLDCRRLIITVIVLLRLPYRWIPVEILELIHVINNISLRYIWLLFFSNQSVSTLWVIHNNAWRSLYKWQFIQVSDLSVSQ